jgi:hypothetical protein
MSKIISFRGLLADEGQDKLFLSTRTGEQGYRIIKFQLFPYNPATFTQESLVMVTKTKQTVASATNAVTDFSSDDLLGAALYTSDATGANYPEDTVVVFDGEVFNQSIFISHTDQAAGAKINYYLELEVMKLNKDEATVATLQNIRQSV